LKAEHTFLNDQWAREKVREEIQRFLEFQENENKICQNLWDTTKAVLIEKFKAMSAYTKRKQRSHINELMLHHKLLEKQQTERNNKNNKLNKVCK
jgi:hypothetical protein